MRMKKNNSQGIRSRGQIPYHLFCLHRENGLTGIPKICTRNYECRHCTFDQWLDEMVGCDVAKNVSQNIEIHT